MKYALFFWVLFFNTIFMFSQSEYKKSVDSLYVLINETNDNVTTINHYKALCDIYKEYDLAHFRKCNAVILSIAKKANSAQGYGFYYCNQSKLIAYTNLQEAITYAEKGKEQFYKIKDWNNYIYACSLIGSHLNANQESDKGIQLLQETLPLAIKIDSDYLSSLYHELSKLYRSSGDDVHAIYYAKKGLTCKKPLKNKYLIYHGIAIIYVNTGRYAKALEYNELDMRFAKSPQAKYSALYRRAEILIELGRSKEGLPLLIKCLRYYEKQKATLDIIDTQYMVSYGHYKLGNYKKANYYIDEVIKSPSLLKYDKIFFFCHKADICLSLNDIVNATLFTNKAASLIDDNTASNAKKIVYSTKIALEKRLGNYKAAFDYQEKVAAIKETNYRNDSEKKTYELEADLDITEKNIVIKNLQIAQLKKQVEITTKNNYIIYISIALMMALLSVFFYVKNYRTIKKKNLIIESEKLLVKKSLIEKETLLKEIHHRVKNNLQLVMSLLNIQAQEATINITDFVAISQSRILSMSLIHESLYQNQNLSEVDFKSYIENLTHNIVNSYNYPNKDIILQLEIEELYVDIQTALPLGLIINELINNAYKHAFPNHQKGNIFLKLINKEKHYKLIIGDTGVGFKKNEIPKNTLGLQLVEDLVFQLRGQLKIENQEGGIKYIILFNKS